MNLVKKNFITHFGLSLVLLSLFQAEAFASGGSGLPWEEPLQAIVNSITGPVAQALGALIMFSTGIAMWLGDVSGGAKRFLQAAVALSVAFTASSFFLSFLGFSGGALL